MSELPYGWASASGNDLFNLVTSGSRGWAKYYSQSGALFVRIGNLQRGSTRIDLDDLQYVSLPSDVEGVRTKLSPGDILISITADLGLIAEVDHDLPEAYVNQHIALVRPIDTNLTPYVARYLLSPIGQAEIGAANRGVTRAGLGLDDIRNLQVPLAPEPEQRRIVAKIDSLRARSSRARQELDHIPKLIERYKQAILAKAFSGELTKEWRERNDAEEWQSVVIEDVAEAIFDGPFGSNLKSDDYVDVGVRVVRLENIGHLAFKGDKQTFISEEKYSQLRRHTLLPDDVIFSSFVDEEVRVCLFPKHLGTAAINKADCFCIRTNSGICEPKWLAMRLACRSTYETLRDAVHGATRPRINLGTLKSFSFELPSEKEQCEIVRCIEHAFAWLDKIATEHARAEHLLPKLDQAILAKAFRGELVPQDPNDEPASALLERIKAEREGSHQPNATRRKSEST